MGDFDIVNETKDDNSQNPETSIPVLNLTDILQFCPFAAIFYSFFLVDILGDEVGIYHGYWAPVFIIAFSLMVFLIFYCKKMMRKDFIPVC